jgi:ubiquinone/menaquinone biosynthesis C-methylase UbiE
MSKVDYNDVARRYDANPIRLQAEADPAISAGARRVLDLACGTGTYLAAQTRAFAGQGVAFCGVDASEGMLAVARGKLPPTCELRHGRAEAIPYADAAFDYVTARFAFHHFADKAKALGEMARVLAPGGRLSLVNLVPELSPTWWLYRYFPESIATDQDRFWPFELIREALAARGFTAAVKTWPVGPMALEAAVAEARNRETSQLVLISDAAYARGLSALEAELARAPGTIIDSGLILGELAAYRS